MLKLRPDLIQFTPHGYLEFIYRFMERKNLYLRASDHIDHFLPKYTKNIVINYITKLRKLIKDRGYGDYNIINMDETPLYFNIDLNKTIVPKLTKNV